MHILDSSHCGFSDVLLSHDLHHDRSIIQVLNKLQQKKNKMKYALDDNAFRIPLLRIMYTILKV